MEDRAVVHNLTRKRGDVFKAMRFKMWGTVDNTVDPPVYSDPINCTNASIRLQVRKTKLSKPVIEWSTEAETIIIENNNEVVLLKRLKAETNFDQGVYEYDIEFEFTVDEPETYIKGTYTQVNDTSSKA